MTDNTPDTQLEEITETGTPNIPDHTATPYTPVFNNTVRTVIYVVTLVLWKQIADKGERS